MNFCGMFVIETPTAGPPYSEPCLKRKVQNEGKIFDALRAREDAERIIQNYVAGWKIERFHYVLKSDCKIEEKQARSYGNLSILTLLYSVIALIILSLTYMGQGCPDPSANLVFTMEECRVLYHAANKTREEIHYEYTIKEALDNLSVSESLVLRW